MPRDRGDTTPFGWPPLPGPYTRPFPDEVPWDVPIAELSGFWLERRCRRCHDERATYPLRLLAAMRGWSLTLRQLVPRIKCSNCGEPPTWLWLSEDAAGAGYRAGPAKKRLPLVPFEMTPPP